MTTTLNKGKQADTCQEERTTKWDALLLRVTRASLQTLKHFLLAAATGVSPESEAG